MCNCKKGIRTATNRQPIVRKAAPSSNGTRSGIGSNTRRIIRRVVK